MNFDIQMDRLNGWSCTVCVILVPIENGVPSSKYWNVEREEVYCGAAHSLQRHEEIRSLLVSDRVKVTNPNGTVTELVLLADIP